ncbi:MAG: hypothetical protein ABR903_02055 [Thermodesulfovibrionales bacterium]
MKKTITILILLAVEGLVAANFSVGDAAVFSLGVTVYASLCGRLHRRYCFGDHAVITYESTDHISAAILLLSRTFMRCR